MRLIGSTDAEELVQSIDWLAEAERIGTVELRTGGCHTHGRCCCRLTLGRWEVAYLHVWGHGASTDEACREAVEKARPFVKSFPHPKEA